MMDVLGYFAEGLRRYRAGDFKAAMTQFERALAKNPMDKLSGTYVERCRHLMEFPPIDWTGVWVMTEK